MGYPQQQYFPPPQGSSQPHRPQYPQQQSIPQQNALPIPPQKSTLEETLQAFMEMSKQSMESQASTIKRLETTVGQLSGALNQIQQQQQPGKFHGQPAQTYQALAVTVLRSGKMVDNKVKVPNLTSAEQPHSAFTSAEQPSSIVTRAEKPSFALTRAEKPSSVQPRPEFPSSALTSPTDGEMADKQKEGEKEKEVKLHKATAPYRPPIPFPNRLRNEKQDRQFEEFYNMLAKVNVNLPLLDVIRNVPAYVKLFKELASNKRRFGDNEKVLVSEVANAIMQQSLPPKQRDPELGNLKSTRMCLQLADRSVRYPLGIVEDILVRVGGLIVPIDFVVLEIGGCAREW
ncbi:uncharacterized protein LOC130995058 [Salvia miltiorrhiza]|uniref:uncharacterized protein LOC130995058 n=1 Tax=Salvia miltiorrhiza TaxID=226208 RepID=UPI0025AD72C5|nr:uncharacterized protein LOC130995058 [Salvia miltiorrhiza]